ncbi:hypothetical protein PBY51_007395 [Eleginops maclovinus]|uniref:Uncharacterized protein n=1 Tax=Eleginops maclovinus TaxID=56733 RepID=A0AAN7X161_ELEMC|nr:hypothetical protein PBY51_007395 [Eleginops maclovinus]
MVENSPVDEEDGGEVSACLLAECGPHEAATVTLRPPFLKSSSRCTSSPSLLLHPITSVQLPPRSLRWLL